MVLWGADQRHWRAIFVGSGEKAMGADVLTIGCSGSLLGIR
jgi:hypothetical protein